MPHPQQTAHVVPRRQGAYRRSSLCTGAPLSDSPFVRDSRQRFRARRGCLQTSHGEPVSTNIVNFTRPRAKLWWGQPRSTDAAVGKKRKSPYTSEPPRVVFPTAGAPTLESSSLQPDAGRHTTCVHWPSLQVASAAAWLLAPAEAATTMMKDVRPFVPRTWSSSGCEEARGRPSKFKGAGR